MQVKIGPGKVAEPDFQRNGLPPELPNVQMRSGLTILSTPILRGTSSENFSATLPESSARRRHWGQGFPLQARFDIKTLCLRETPALQGGRFTAGGKSIPWLKLAYMKILPTLHKAEVTILEQLVVKHHVRI